jgi:hypothetical protein
MQTTASQPALPPSSTIRETAREVLSRPYYDLDMASPDYSMPLVLRLIEWMLMPFRWLYESMEGWPEVVRWIIVAVSVLVLIALIAHIVYTLVTAIRGPTKSRDRQYAAERREANPVDLEREAEQAGGRGDYIGAIRLLFRAALRRIELAEKKNLRPGWTNRELLRRYKSKPFSSSLERLVEMIDQKWYGGQACEQGDYLACRGEHAQIREYVQEPRPAVGT